MDATAPAARFAWIIAILCRAIAESSAKGGFAWIFRGLAAGPRATPRRPRNRKPDAAPPRATPPLPRGFAWLHGPVPEAAASAGMLHQFLNDPEMQKLLAADPRFGRILRPLCHMLGLRPPAFLRLVRAGPSPAPAAMPAEPSAPPAPALGLPKVFRPPIQPQPAASAQSSSHNEQRAPPSLANA